MITIEAILQILSVVFAAGFLHGRIKSRLDTIELTLSHLTLRVDNIAAYQQRGNPAPPP